MKIIKRIFGISASVLCFTGLCRLDEQLLKVNAEDNLIFDYSEIIDNPQYQFYYSDDNEFYIDGIKVYYNNSDVTSDSVIKFYTTPASTYNGKSNDYTIPFIAEYNGIVSEGQIDVKIGLRGDANCDNQINENDIVLIENELLQVHSAGNSTLSVNDGFGIFLANVDGRQTSGSRNFFGNNDLNIADAMFLGSYFSEKPKGSLYDNVILKNAVKPKKGEIYITGAECSAGDIVTVYVSEKSENTLGAFDWSFEWSNTELELLSVSPANENISVYSYVNENKLRVWGFENKSNFKDRKVIALNFRVPETASVNTVYNISVTNVNYFGTGYSIASKVSQNSGQIKVTGKTVTNPYRITGMAPDSQYPYKYGVKAWNKSVEYGTTKVSIPVMLLGGFKTKEMTLTVQCDNPVSVKNLPHSFSTNGSSDEGMVGMYYHDDDYFTCDFETLEVEISKNAGPGTYPIRISAQVLDDEEVNSELSVFYGSVTIKDKALISGDANNDDKLDIRDAAFIAKCIANNKPDELHLNADYNDDDKINIRDAAAIAKALSSKNK